MSIVLAHVATLPRSGLWQRANRVTALVSVVAVLSLADLYMTLMHLTTIGMLEANPIARWIMQNLSPVSVVAWKFFTVAIASAILMKVRQRRCGEVAAWICAIVLLWLMARWIMYADHLSLLSAEDMQLVAEGHDSAWVMTEPAG